MLHTDHAGGVNVEGDIGESAWPIEMLVAQGNQRSIPLLHRATGRLGALRPAQHRGLAGRRILWVGDVLGRPAVTGELRSPSLPHGFRKVLVVEGREEEPW